MATMLDLETLGKTPGCVVVQIGLLEFSEMAEPGTFGKMGKINLDYMEGEKFGLTIDDSTVEWWERQDPKVRSMVFDGIRVPYEKGMRYAEAFLKKVNGDDGRVWCRGGSFDFPILSAAFRAVGIAQPWNFRNEMDLRTLANFAYDVEKPTTSKAHDALEDCKVQALHVQRIYSKYFRG